MKDEKQQEPMDSSHSVSEQREFVKLHIDQSIDLGQTWYLLDVKWFESWKDYVNYDNTASNSTSAAPGPIDNSELLTSSGRLKEGLLENSQFAVIPKKVWEMLLKCYGLVADQDPLDRCVIEVGQFSKSKMVEIYGLELYLSHYKNPTNGELVSCSKGMTVGELTDRMRKMYKVSDAAEVKLMGSYMSASYEDLMDNDQNLYSANLQPEQYVVILEKEGANWPDPNQYKKTSASSFSSASKITNSSSSVSMTNKNSSDGRYLYGDNGYGTTSYNGSVSASSHNSDKYSQPSNAGLCGLSNLGNTCFMNSALQCLSNVPDLKDFFISDRWRKDLNTRNPLGMKGEIAETYASLMKSMWSGKTSCCAPRPFKGAVGRFAPRFSGYHQQDSHELMAFLLDGLHEDLNRIDNKPYIESKDTDERPDEEVAKEAWEDYKKRNDSIIIDLFHGQLKSTLTCPTCKQTSITFDPTCYLSLPIPGRDKKPLTVYFVSCEPIKPPLKCKVKVPTDGCVEDLCQAVAEKLDLPRSWLMAAELHNARFHRIYQSTFSLRSIRDGDKIFIYKVDPSERKTVVAVYFKEAEKKYTAGNNKAINWPVILAVPKSVTYNRLYDIIRDRYSQFINVDEERAYLNGLAEKSDVGNEKSTREELDLQEPMDVSTSPSALLNDDDIAKVHKPSISSSAKGYASSISERGEEAFADAKMNSGEDKIAEKTIRELFQLEMVSQYGNKESSLPRDGPITLSKATYSYISVEFEKKLLCTVISNADPFAITEHESLHEVEKEKEGVTLKDCLELFTSREKLGKHDAWYCPKCKEHVQADKEFALWKLPKYLVIQLKRYKSSYSTYSYGSRDKIGTFVSYPLDNLDLSEFVKSKQIDHCRYDLIAVSNHFGGLGGGHYTAFAKNHHLRKWYNFDDSSVSPTSESSIVSKSGYLLVYARQEG